MSFYRPDDTLAAEKGNKTGQHCERKARGNSTPKLRPKLIPKIHRKK